MKKIYLKSNSRFPYIDTDVALEKSIDDIKKLLKKFQCEEILQYESGETMRLIFKKGGVPYIIDFPVIYIEGKGTAPRLAMQVSGRIVFNEIKATLVNVEMGALDFMQAMLRHIALPAPQGITSLGELVESQKDKIIKGQLIELDPTKIKLLPEGR